MRTATSLLAIAAFLTTSVFAAEVTEPPASANDFPRDVLTGIDAMRRLPAQGLHVIESHGRLLLVTTNGHYVVMGGRLIDLWNQLEVHSVKDVEATSRIPLAKMGIEARTLGGLTAGKTDATRVVTVFLDPASAESRKILPTLRELAKLYRIDLVFVPAQPARSGVTRALICDRRAAQTFFADGRPPDPVPDAQPCGLRELERTRATVQLLGITALPFTVAPNGTTLGGSPANYAAFIGANLEAP